MRPTLALCRLVTLLTLILGVRGPAAAQTTLVTVRDSYAAADYSAALQLLDELARGQAAGPDAEEAARLRLLCLLALGRAEDARAAAHALVEQAPFVELTEEDASPSVRARFAEWRMQVLPRAAQARFSVGRAAFARREYEAAGTAFRQAQRLLDELGHGDEAGETGQDLRLLVAGFLDLIAAGESATKAPPAAQPATPPPAPATAEPPAPASAPLSTSTPSTAGPDPDRGHPASTEDAARIHTVGDPRVVAPRPVSQEVPAWPAALPRSAAVGRSLVLEILVGLDGSVETVRVRQGVHAVYDTLVARAAKAWRYEPATLDGRPVRFIRAMEVRLAAR